MEQKVMTSLPLPNLEVEVEVVEEEEGVEVVEEEEGEGGGELRLFRPNIPL
jgi:hypothetical protein